MADQPTSAGLETPVWTPQFSLRIHAGKQYRLQVRLPECIVGQAADADIRLAHPSIAPRHCCFYWANKKQLWVKALEGEVTLAGRLLQKALLRPGDILDLGPVRLEVLAIRAFGAVPGQDESPRDGRSASSSAPTEPEVVEPWWHGLSSRLDQLEQWFRRLKADEGDLADFCARLEALERRFTAPLPEHHLEQALAPLLQRLERLERRHARLLRRILRWRHQQERWQRHLEEELRHWDTQARQLSQQLEQAQQSLQRAWDHYQHLAEQVAELKQAEAEATEQAGKDTLEQALRQIEHLEWRFRELEQWTRCLRRELRNDTHSEVESRLADLRAEREALETLRQEHGAAPVGIPATAPGVGFPVAKEKTSLEADGAPSGEPSAEGGEHAEDESPPERVSAEPSLDSDAAAPAEESPAADPDGELLPPAEAEPGNAPAEENLSQQDPPELPAETGPEQQRVAALADSNEQASEQRTSACAAEPRDDLASSSTSEEAHGKQPASEEDHLQETPASSEQPAEAEAEDLPCRLSTVALFRRLGIQVPGLDTQESESSAALSDQATPEPPTQQQEETPEAPQEPAPTAPEASENEAARDAENEHDAPTVPGAATFEGESVEDYMARLLQSIEPDKASAPSTPNEPEEEPAPEQEQQYTTPVPAAKEPEPDTDIPAEVLKAAPGSLPATLEDTSKEHPARVIPAESPETLHSLRRLANKSARTAIETYQRRLKISATQAKLVVSVLAMAASFAMMWFAGSLPHKWVYGAAFGSLGISVYYGLRYLMLTAQSTAAEEDLLEED